MKARNLYAVLFFIFVSAVLSAQDSAESIPPEESVSAPAAEEAPASGGGVPEEAAGKAAKNVFTMGEIVVREKAVACIEDAATGTELDGASIELRGEKVLGDSLSMVPGVQVTQHRKGNMQFYMRGYDMNMVAILVDGIPITDAYGGNMDIGNISVLNLAKISVNRGTSSALYGTRGAAGSINMVTKRPEFLYGESTVEYGLNDSFMFNAAQGAPVGKLFYWITASLESSEGYEIMPGLEAGLSAAYNRAIKKNSTYMSTMQSSYTRDLERWSRPVLSDGFGNMSSYWPDYHDYNFSPYLSFESGGITVKANGFFYEQSNTLEAFKNIDETHYSWNQTEDNTRWLIWTSQSYGASAYPSFRLADWNKLNCAVLAVVKGISATRERE